MGVVWNLCGGGGAGGRGGGWGTSNSFDKLTKNQSLKKMGGGGEAGGSEFF